MNKLKAQYIEIGEDIYKCIYNKYIYEVNCTKTREYIKRDITDLFMEKIQCGFPFDMTDFKIECSGIQSSLSISITPISDRAKRLLL